MRRIAGMVIAVALGIAASGGRVAAAEGEFDVVYSATNGTDGAWLQTGPNRRQQMNALELTTQEDAAFLGTTRAACQYTREEDTTSGAYTNTGWCAWRDKDGGMLFENWEGSAAGGDAVLIGSGRLVGGTGKFDGLSGSLTWRYDGQLGRQRGLFFLPDK